MNYKYVFTLGASIINRFKLGNNFACGYLSDFDGDGRRRFGCLGFFGRLSQVSCVSPLAGAGEPPAHFLLPQRDFPSSMSTTNLAIQRPIMSNSKKRAAEDVPSSKKAKKKKKGNSQEDDSLDTEIGVNTLFSRIDNQLLADYLAQKTTRFGSDLSPVEISDLTLSGNYRPSLAAAVFC